MDLYMDVDVNVDVDPAVGVNMDLYMDVDMNVYVDVDLDAALDMDVEQSRCGCCLVWSLPLYNSTLPFTALIYTQILHYPNPRYGIVTSQQPLLSSPSHLINSVSLAGHRGTVV